MGNREFNVEGNPAMAKHPGGSRNNPNVVIISNVA